MQIRTLQQFAAKELKVVHVRCWSNFLNPAHAHCSKPRCWTLLLLLALCQKEGRDVVGASACTIYVNDAGLQRVLQAHFLLPDLSFITILQFSIPLTNSIISFECKPAKIAVTRLSQFQTHLTSRRKRDLIIARQDLHC